MKSKKKPVKKPRPRSPIRQAANSRSGGGPHRNKKAERANYAGEVLAQEEYEEWLADQAFMEGLDEND